jgi:ketosteroid isomerase-like protein
MRTLHDDIDLEIDRTEIGWLLAKRASAMKAMDADYLASRFAPGCSGSGPIPSDAAALRSWFDGFERSIEYAVRDLSITVGDDVAFAHSLDRLSATPIGGRRFQLWLRATTGLRRISGRWLITHEHRSTEEYPLSLPG